MKWAVFFGFLGLGCGYLLNDVLADRKSGEEEYRIPALPIGVTYFSEYPRTQEGVTVSEFVGLGSLVKIQKKEAFPELLGALDGLQQVDTRTDWPLKKLALLRWYQLDARSFLKWIRENPEVCPKGNFEVVICEIVKEEYYSHPSFSYEVIEKLVLELGAYPEGAKASEWTYNIGRYSRDLPLRLEYLESLHGLLKHGDYQLSPNRSANGWRDEDDNRGALIRGVLDRNDGGVALARRYFTEHDQVLLEDLDEAIEQEKFEALLNDDWREIKRKLEGGGIKVSWMVKRAVLEGWAKEDDEAAMAWFLGDGDVEASALREIVESRVFRSRKWQGAEASLDLNSVITFLEECDLKGHPTEAAWDLVSQEAIGRQDPDPFVKIMPKLTQESLKERITEVARNFSEGYDGWLAVGQSSFRFLGLSDDTRTYLERLEIAELVEIEIRRLNLIEVKKLEKAILEEGGS